MISTVKNLFQIDKRKGIAGILLAITAFAVFFFCYHSVKYGAFFSVLFLCVGFVRLNVKKPAWIYTLTALWALACILFTYAIPYREVFQDYTLSEFQYLLLPNITSTSLRLNLLCIATVIGLFCFITGRLRLSIVIGSSALIVLAVVNSFIFDYRGNELIFADLMSWKTALNVAGQYDLRLHYRTAVLLGLWIVLAFGGWTLPPMPKQQPLRQRLAAGILLLILGTSLFQRTENLAFTMWGRDGTLFNGYYLHFYLSIQRYFVEKPDAYSDQKIADMEAQYSTPTNAPASLPNILVVMNESFADLRIIGDLRTNQPVTPFLNALEENTIKGYALASIFGGSTANSEYEFLTGNTAGLLPAGSIPYQQYVKHPSSSLVHVLNNLGYYGLATHPYDSSGWSRTTVYPFFGFSDSTFIEAYPCQDLIRGFVSDAEMYDYILEQLKKSTNAPLFLFSISMQNHGGYAYVSSNFTNTIALEGYTQDYPQAQEYLSLIQLSDQALQDFLTALKAFPEDTVVLFFGDHMPNIEKEFYEELHGGPYETLTEQTLQYTVPFVIWANYDIPEQTVEKTSLNYLGRYLLEAAGIDLPPYYQFLKELETVIPAINAQGYHSRSQNAHLPISEATGEEAQWLQDYAILQYNSIFDKSGQSQVFFGQYLP